MVATVVTCVFVAVLQLFLRLFGIGLAHTRAARSGALALSNPFLPAFALCQLLPALSFGLPVGARRGAL